MKILVDSNIIISSGMNLFGTPSQALRKVMFEHQLYVSEATVVELDRFAFKKVAKKYPESRKFFDRVLSVATIIPTLNDENPLELQIRDEDDRPILRAAIYAGVDIILTGDRDFLESGIESPRIMTTSEFLDL